jgi:putative transport protein
MEAVRQLLVQSEPLLLFVVISLGYLLGQAKFRGFSLGIAGVLFVGLAFGAWRGSEGSKPLQIAHQVMEVGLIVFVYAVGLTTGPGFFSALRSKGLRYNAAAIGALLVGATVAFALGYLLEMRPGLVAGVFSGALTNTPALAATTQLMNATDPSHAADPALGYSVSYPFGVLGGLLAFQLFVWVFDREYREEKRARAEQSLREKSVESRNFTVANRDVIGLSLEQLCLREKHGLVISRLRRKGEKSIVVPTRETILAEGDTIVVVGTLDRHEQAGELFGPLSSEHLEQQREAVEMRRILLSNHRLVGRHIGDLRIDTKFNAQITRLRRADVDIVPTPDMVLEMGDRLRVVAPRERLADVAKYFGDSDRAVAELDYTALTLGISLGVLAGMIPIPIPGIGSISLGFAGGPLIVAIILGKLGRTGPIVWNLPLESNLALRHLGLLFFLAGVGVSSGSKFLSAFSEQGSELLAVGAIVTATTSFMMMLLMRYLAGAKPIDILGATSGVQTQPATLAKARELSETEDVYVGYATTYPVAMIGKIVLAQVLVVVLRAIGGE